MYFMFLYSLIFLYEVKKKVWDFPLPFMGSTICLI